MACVNGINEIDSLRLSVRQQGELVRKLKSENASQHEIQLEVSALKKLKKDLEDKEIALLPNDLVCDRSKLEDLLVQRFFYDRSFSIYGGVQGLYDFGPMGCAMKTNLIAAWREFFILEDHLLEVDCSILTPEIVLKTSGHVDRFTDFMVKDVKTGDCFRADHLIKGSLEAKLNDKKTLSVEKDEINHYLLQLDNFAADELNAVINKYSIKSPTTNNDLTEPQQFNLMFSTSIGPTGQNKGYLRPETAQGIFLNFKRLLQFNQGRLPFGAAQIGTSFRNEISPRSGLIRVREFMMAEIEFFVDPKDKNYPKFNQVQNVELVLYPACDQMDGAKPRVLSIGEAVKTGLVANQTLGYFMARIYLFLTHIGVDPKRLRFRQHLSNEMAHYACDCWDAECLTTYGWLECVGCADRSCYDLTQHANATGARLVAERVLDKPRIVETYDCIVNKAVVGKKYRDASKEIISRLSSLTLDESIELKNGIESKGKACLKLNDEKSVEIDSSMVKLKEIETTEYVEEFVPNVIEPSFGIGRILYSIFEHSFSVREDDAQRTYLSVPAILAPYKCSILPISNQSIFADCINNLSAELTKNGVSHRIEQSSGSIGRRYARTDQIAIPYGITVDFDTVNIQPASATLRERDSMKQIRVPINELPMLVADLTNGVISWPTAQNKYPTFTQQETGNDKVKIKESSVLTVRPITPQSEHKTGQNLVGLQSGKKNKKSASNNRQTNLHTNQLITTSAEHGKTESMQKSSEQNDNQLSASLISMGLPRINSGYEADQEDNLGSRCTSTNDGMFKNPLLSSDTSTLYPAKPDISYHGLFAGEGWCTRLSQSKVDPVSVEPICDKPEISYNIVDDWKYTVSQLYPSYLENEMFQYMGIMEDRIESSYKQNMEETLLQPVCDQMVLSKKAKKYHGLFSGPGWPEEKHKKQTDIEKLQNTGSELLSQQVKTSKPSKHNVSNGTPVTENIKVDQSKQTTNPLGQTKSDDKIDQFKQTTQQAKITTSLEQTKSDNKIHQSKQTTQKAKITNPLDNKAEQSKHYVPPTEIIKSPNRIEMNEVLVKKDINIEKSKHSDPITSIHSGTTTVSTQSKATEPTVNLHSTIKNVKAADKKPILEKDKELEEVKQDTLVQTQELEIGNQSEKISPDSKTTVATNRSKRSKNKRKGKKK